MKGTTSENIIIPVVEGFLKVSTVSKGIFLKIKCYDSRESTSTLLSDDDILEALSMRKDYCGQLMIKCFEQTKIEKLPPEETDNVV